MPLRAESKITNLTSPEMRRLVRARGAVMTMSMPMDMAAVMSMAMGRVTGRDMKVTGRDMKVTVRDMKVTVRDMKVTVRDMNRVTIAGLQLGI